MKKECPICGEKTLVEKTGTFRFNPPENIPGGEIRISHSRWEECEVCKEAILSPDLIGRLERERYARLELLTPEEIKAVREKAGLTQAQIADKLGIGKKTYTRWETGKILQNKSSDTLIRLFDRCPDSFDYLRCRPFFSGLNKPSQWKAGKWFKSFETATLPENRKHSIRVA